MIGIGVVWGGGGRGWEWYRAEELRELALFGRSLGLALRYQLLVFFVFLNSEK